MRGATGENIKILTHVALSLLPPAALLASADRGTVSDRVVFHHALRHHSLEARESKDRPCLARAREDPRESSILEGLLGSFVKVLVRSSLYIIRRSVWEGPTPPNHYQ